MDRKKELKDLYKQMKQDMGVLMIKHKNTKKCFLEATPNIKARFNSTKLKLDAGYYYNKELQADWSKFGSAEFEVKVLELLEYDKDESKTDYSADLELLKDIWEEKLKKEEYVFYK